MNAAHLLDEEEMTGTDGELHLGMGSLIGIFFGLALVCGVFMGFGYMMGHRTPGAFVRQSRSTFPGRKPSLQSHPLRFPDSPPTLHRLSSRRKRQRNQTVRSAKLKIVHRLAKT